MSKSLGNILPVREFLKDFSPNAFRLFISQSHYRSPIDYSTENVRESERALGRFKEFRRRVRYASYGKEKNAREAADRLKARFIEYMDDDFNTPKAVSEIFNFIREVNSLIDAGTEEKASLEYALNIFDELISVMGLDLGETVELSPEDLDLIKKREEYRREKNWEKSDKIRDILADKGLILIDEKDGSTRVEIRA